jgi:hypothetical protein
MMLLSPQLMLQTGKALQLGADSPAQKWTRIAQAIGSVSSEGGAGCPPSRLPCQFFNRAILL